MDKCCDMIRTIRFVMAARMAGLKTRAESAFFFFFFFKTNLYSGIQARGQDRSVSMSTYNLR